MDERVRAIDESIDRAIDGAAVMTVSDRQLESMSHRIVALFQRELAERGYQVVRVRGESDMRRGHD